MNRKVFAVIGNIFIYFVVLGLLSSSFAILMNEKQILEFLYGLNFSNTVPIGIVLLVCSTLLGFPPTRRIGLFTCTLILGGYILAEFIYSKGTSHFGYLLLALLWSGAIFRDPQLFGIPDFYRKD